MDESTERLLHNSSLASSGNYSDNFLGFLPNNTSSCIVSNVEKDDDVACYLASLSPEKQRQLDEFVQITDLSMVCNAYNNSIGANQNFGRPVSMYEPWINHDSEYSSLPPDLVSSSDFNNGDVGICERKFAWEAEDAEYIETLNESREVFGYNPVIYSPAHNQYDSTPDKILVAADIHRNANVENSLYARVQKPKKHQQLMMVSTNSNSDPPLEKLPKIMTQSCYGELNQPIDIQWNHNQHNLIQSCEDLLDEGTNYNISSIMTSTTNSSIIDGNSSMDSSIYEQISSVNSSAEMSRSSSTTTLVRPSGERQRVKWWDDLTEETTTELQDIIDQDLAAIRKILENETGGSSCPSCQMPFDKGKKRKLIDTCGHERCYSCMFKNEACTLCKIQRHQEAQRRQTDFQSNSNKKSLLNDYDTGIGSTTTLLSSPQPVCRSQVKTNGHFTSYMQTRAELSSPDLLYSKLKSRPPKCPTSMQQQQQQQCYVPPPTTSKSSLSHLKGLMDLNSNNGNTVTTRAEVCATPPQNRRRLFIPKHLRSPFGIYRNRSNGNGSAHDNNSALSAFFHKSLSGLSSLNSSMNSDTGLIATSTPNQTPTKCKPKDNKENKFHRFGGAVVNAMGVGAEGKIKKSHLVSSASHFPSLVFGKIKSLWSASTTNTTIGLNLLADSDRPKKRRSKNLEVEVEMQNVTVTSDDEGGHVKPLLSPKSKNCHDDELQVRLGFFLENNHARNRTSHVRGVHQQSLSSLTSANTSPVSTLTGSSEADMSRVTMQEQSQKKICGPCDSIGSLMSVSISEQSNASSSPLSRRHSVTNSQNGQAGGCGGGGGSATEDLALFKTRKTTARRSARSALIKGPIDPKIRFAQYRQPAQLPLKPLFFEVPLQEPDPLFIGRNWLVRELATVISTNDCTGVLLNGNLGTGKTALMLQLVEYSCFGRRNDAAIQEHEGIYCQINVPNERFRSLASNVVAYHFCQADNNSTCLVPDFIHSLAAQLCQAPQLASYNEFLLNEPHLQNVLSVKECIADPERALKMGILEPLEGLKRQGKIPTKYCIILIDALCEAEYHRPDHGDTISSFLSTMTHCFPPWLKIIATVRSQMVEFTKGLPYTKITLDNWATNESLQKDILDYIVFRLNHSPSIQNNIGVGGSGPASGGTLMINKESTNNHHQHSKFAQHLLALSRGSFLFAKLTLDLIERGHLVIKSTSYKVLPVSLAQIFLLNFNMRYPTQTAYEKISSILSVCLAALYPLTLLEIFYSVNALVTEEPVEWNEFLQRFKMLSGFLVKRIDNTYMFFHPSFREWLIRRDDGESSKFTCDLRTGHAAIALRLSRLQAPLDAEQTLELGHHILKAHIYRNAPQTQSPRDMQAFWIASVTKCASSALCTLRNVYSPNVKVSRLLLLGGASPDFQSTFLGNAPILCIAAHEGIVPMVSLLLEFGADVEKANSQECTPLILSAIKGHCDVVRQLVAAGSCLGQTDTQQRCALVHAAMTGNYKIVKYLVACDWIKRDHSSSDVSLEEAAQQSLVAAASQGHTSIVEDLLDMPEVLINALDAITGETALTVASTNGHTETVTVLLSRGASHNIQNRKEMLPLLLAVKEGHWSIVERLIQCQVDLEQTDPNARTALMVAAEEGHVGIIDLLLSKGASHTKVDKDGLTALSWACLRGKQQAAKCLLERNSDLHHMDQHHRTPLDLAAYQGTAALVQMLLDNGAQIEHVDINGMRPLDRAIACRNVQVVQVFLKRGAKLGPATWAMAAGKSEIMLILLNKLLEDGNILYRKNRLQEASHRYQYALKKIPSNFETTSGDGVAGDGEGNTNSNAMTFQQLKFNFLLNLSRCKRKMNEMSESIELASLAVEIKPNNYDGYYARAKGLLEMNRYPDALNDAKQAIEKVKLQQKYQKISVEVQETLLRLHEELSKKCPQNVTTRYPIEDDDIVSYRQSIDMSQEITDL